MSLVKGENFIAYINDSGVWKPYICARNISLNINTEFLETSTSGNGLFATYVPTKNSFTASTDGIVDLNPSGDLTLEDLQDRQLAQTIFQMQFLRLDESGNSYNQLGYFFIFNCSDSGSYDGLDLFSVTLQGTGPLTKLTRFDYTWLAPGTTFTDASLIGKTIIKVDRMGFNYTIITTGSPSPFEVLYNTITGAFTFAIPSTTGQTAYVLYY